MEFYKAAIKYLQSCNIKVSKQFFRDRIQSHPDYPALVSLTDTLDEIGLPYSAIIADKEKYKQLEYPLLAHVKQKRTDDFILVKSPADFENLSTSLLNIWNGIALMIKTEQPISHVKHNEWLIKEKKETMLFRSVAAFFTAALIASAFINFTINGLLLILLSIAGIGICGLIVMHTMGKNNILTEQLCSGDDNKGCDKVLKSKIAGISDGISLGDLGFVYFAGTSVFFAIMSITKRDAYPILISLSAISVLLSIFSVYYQWKVVKSWCRMCLLTVVVLWLQAILAFQQLFSIDFRISIGSVTVLTFSLMLTFLSWLVLKSLIIKADASLENKIAILKLKRKPDVFLALLNKQVKIDVNPWGDDLIFGNRNAPIKIIAACNPYCAPCAKAHNMLEDLMELFGDCISLTIRFTLHIDDITERRTAAVVNIISAYNEQGKSASTCIRDWYADMDLRKFKLIYNSKADLNSYMPLVRKQIEWTERNELRFTPRIYLEGFQLPREYQIDELKLLINQLLENITPMETLANVLG